MKRLIVAVAIPALLAGNLFASGHIVKQRAKELRDQHNVRQGVPGPAQPPPSPPAASQTPPAAGRPATPAPTPQQQHLALLQADLAAIKARSQITPEQKQQFARDLRAVAQPTARPSRESLAKLAEDLTAALADKNLVSTDRTRLAQNLLALLNSASLPQSQVEAIVSDVQAVLQVAGATRPEAVKVAEDLKAIVAEIQKG